MNENAENNENPIVNALRQINMQNELLCMTRYAKQLLKYAQHKSGCHALARERDDKGRFARYSCNCGLDKIKREIDRTI